MASLSKCISLCYYCQGCQNVYIVIRTCIEIHCTNETQCCLKQMKKILALKLKNYSLAESRCGIHRVFIYIYIYKFATWPKEKLFSHFAFKFRNCKRFEPILYTYWYNFQNILDMTLMCFVARTICRTSIMNAWRTCLSWSNIGARRHIAMLADPAYPRKVKKNHTHTKNNMFSCGSHMF